MRPCRKCGVDDRFPSGHCQPCSRSRKRNLTSELASKPCVSCGSTDRNKRGNCKPCGNERSAEWRNAPGVLNTPCKHCGELDRDRYGNCRPCSKTRSREWARANKNRVNPRNRLKKYGITQEQFSELLSSQKGACPICEDPLPQRFVVDHDHNTGVVRGLLCNPCNLALGLLRDEPRIMQRAASYITKARYKGAPECITT
jgi:hypothetical protein